VNFVGPTLQISSDDPHIGIAGNPPPGTSTPSPKNFIGVANLAAFCQNQGYGYDHILPDSTKTNPPDLMIQCATLANKQTQNFSGDKVCQEQFGKNPIDRIVNYNDPSTFECYKDLKYLGPIGQNAADFNAACKSVSQNTGLYDNQSERATAYNWACQPKDHHLLPRGLSVTTACQLKYKNKKAFDRLVDYNKPAGWQCFAPA
jgi:hypothetical protein